MPRCFSDLAEVNRSLAALLVLGVALTSCARPAADLPVESSYRIDADVGPALVCPADPIAVSWHVQTIHEPYEECTAGDADCRFPLGMEAETSPGANLFASEPVSNDELMGQRTLYPEGSTTVVLTGSRDTGADGVHTIRRTFYVEVLGDEGVDVDKRAIARGRCDGGQPTYGYLPVINVTSLGESVTYGRLCVPEDVPHAALRVAIYVRGEADPTTYVINRGECADLRVVPRDEIQRVAVQPVPFEFPASVSCAPSGAEGAERPPEDMQVVIGLTCLSTER